MEVLQVLVMLSCNSWSSMILARPAERIVAHDGVKLLLVGDKAWC